MTQSLLDALCLAIRALNTLPSFPTGIPDQTRPGRDLSSYELLSRLDQVVRDHTGNVSELHEYAEIDAMIHDIARVHLGLTTIKPGQSGHFTVFEIKRALAVAYHAGKFSVGPKRDITS